MTSSTRPLRTALIAMVALTALSGCVRIGSKPPSSLLALTPDSAPAAGASANGTLAEALVVTEPSASAKLAVLRVPVQVDDARLAYLTGAQWVERPARQFQHLLADILRGKGGRLVVEGLPPVTSRGTVIGGRLLDMGFDARAGAVVVRFDAMRQHPDGRVETRRFESTVPGVPGKAEAVGPALNRATNAVAHAVAEWVG